MARIRRIGPTISVRVRVLIAVTVISAAGLAAAGTLTFSILRSVHSQDVDERLRASVETARNLFADPAAQSGVFADLTTSADAVRAVVSGIAPARFQSAVGVVDGRAAFVPGVDVAFSLTDPDLISRFTAETASGDVILGTVESSERTLRYIATPVAVAAASDRGVYVTAFDLDAELSELDTGAVVFLGLAIVTVAAIAAVAWYVAGRALAPIAALNSAAEQITGGRLNVRIPVVGNDDVSALTSTINAMFDRLERSAQDERRLLDDVRHELATPITIMQGHLEVVDVKDGEQVREAHDLVLDELGRMAGLVDELQTLAGSAQPLKTISVDVADLTRQVLAKASAIGGHPWILGATADVRVPADPGRLTQAWLQLADNAAKYSPEGEPIVLGSTATASEVELWVLDRGPGVPDEARERIFDRFGRAEHGRTERGSGLGLAIVAAIAAAHGGRATLSVRPGGSTFGIALPRTDAAT